MIRRWRNLVARRGRFFPTPPRPLAVPGQARRRARHAAATRRGEFLAVLPSLATPVRFLASRRRAVPLARRGEFFTVPVVVAVAGPGPLAPAVRRQARRPQLPTRHGAFATPVPAPQAPAVPGFVPRPGRRAVARSLLIRRGEFLLVPAAPGTLPPSARRNARRLVVTRSGEFWPTPTPTVQPVAPSMAPGWRRARTRTAPLIRAGVFQSLQLFGAAPAVYSPAAEPRLSIVPNGATLAVAANLATASVLSNGATATITEGATP